MKPLPEILGEIRRGHPVDSVDLLPHLSVERRIDRFAVNAALARAFLDAGNVDRAKVFADRALPLADFPEQFLPSYVEIQRLAGDVAAIQEAYKRLGMKLAAEGSIAGAIEHFNSNHYAFQRAGQGDVYKYDLDVLEAVRTLARPYRYDHDKPMSHRADAEKIRVAYLVYGATHSESVLVKLLCLFARHHDRSEFDVTFYVPDRLLPPSSPEAVQYNSLRSRNIERLRNEGGRVIAPASTDTLHCLLDTAAAIRESRPHLLITTAALADYGHYFIRALQPAPVTIGLCYGPPAQFSPPDLDWVISATMHPLIDNPCDGSLVPIEADPPDPREALEYMRADFGIPDDAVVIVCAGRPEKLQNEAYWSALLRVLREHHSAFLVVVGMANEPPFLAAMAPPEVRERFRPLGWRTDYIKILGMADILVDTFPSGGGITLFDAMALGKPVVSFHNDYSSLYNQAEWSVGDEWIEDPDLLIARGDFDQFNAVVSRLVENASLRVQIGARCQAAALRSRGNPERMVRRHEQVYRKVIELVAAQATRPSRLGWLTSLKVRVRRFLLRTRLGRRWILLVRGARDTYTRASPGTSRSTAPSESAHRDQPIDHLGPLAAATSKSIPTRALK